MGASAKQLGETMPCLQDRSTVVPWRHRHRTFIARALDGLQLPLSCGRACRDRTSCAETALSRARPALHPPRGAALVYTTGCSITCLRTCVAATVQSSSGLCLYGWSGQNKVAARHRAMPARLSTALFFTASSGSGLCFH
jgi:hypothetical protein